MLICPICGERLEKQPTAYRCPNRHSYDISRKGYVNLMMSQKSSKKRHGDDKLMVSSRRRFLNNGYYRPIADGAASLIADIAPDIQTAVDIGCGEGYYTAIIHDAFPACRFFGIDISKDALNYAASNKAITLAAASAAALPIESGSMDCAISIFAPIFADEVRRILSESGVLIRAVPLEDHLYGLKKAIYKNAYKNPPEDWALDGFKIIGRKRIEYDISINDPNDIQALFMMTPYYYKTSREDQQRLFNIDHLDTEIRVEILSYI